MDSMERRLIELNEALLNLAKGKATDEKLLLQATRVLAGGTYPDISTGAGNDTVVINGNHDCDCPPGPPGQSGYSGYSGFSGINGESGISGYSGESGYSGYSGYSGFSGAQGDAGECCCQNSIVVDDDYDVEPDDYYIGINSTKPVTITLPTDVEDCITKIIKAEMDAPMGNRKVTITTSDGSLIDDSESVILQSPFETITVVYRGGNWHIVSHF